MNEPLIRVVPATVHGRYLVQPPAVAGRGWLIGFHGYAQNAAVFLDLLRKAPAAASWLLVSVQALHPFYAGRSNEVVANWMTRLDREHAIADNIAYVDAIVASLEQEFGVPSALVYTGYSQGVAMAFRAAVAGRRPCDAILAAGGDIPPELKSPEYRRWPRVVLCTGTRDEYYTPRLLNEDLGYLRSNGVDAADVLFEGGHEWSAEVVRTLDRLLAEAPVKGA